MPGLTEPNGLGQVTSPATASEILLKAGQLGRSEASGPHTHAKMHGHPHMHMDMCTFMDDADMDMHTHRCCLPSTTAI